MRIVFVNTLYPPHGSSGAEITLRFLVGRLAQRGHQCTVVTLSPRGPGTVGAVDDVEVHYLPLANMYWPHGGERPKLLRPLFQALDADNPVMRQRLARVLRRLRPQVVNCHNLQGFSCSAWKAADALDIPVVQTLHDYYSACPRSAMWRPDRGNCRTLCAECRVFGAPRRRASRLPQAVTSVSHRVLDRLTAAGAFGREGQQLRVIRGNNPHGALPPTPEPARGGVLRLGYIGRLDPSKGLSNLLDAVARLPPGAARLLIAGSGPPAYVAALRRIAPQDVEFLGQVEAALFYPRIDLLVVPSVWEDPFPRVFHEALAYGVPTLTTPLGGLPEAIEPGRTGFVAVAADAEALYRVLQTVADGGWDQAAMRAACRREAAAYAPERIVDQYEAVLSATAEGREVPDDAGEAWPRRMVASPTPSRSREAAQ